MNEYCNGLKVDPKLAILVINSVDGNLKWLHTALPVLIQASRSPEISNWVQKTQFLSFTVAAKPEASAPDLSAVPRIK